ncbi:Hypothetical protein I595_853 [Croceitalea dokdonensis DOKDO 023]|uniref:Uncharacterized protein n=1 Tax=Croceitalea dokdonensis DOKDO 023 TaxID=1300341 RepID=A0A0P7AWP7_9FLAO|nr:Hypothetical protein I595_853 [Croceitalea dokdonensis DOKDO 023]
MLLCFFEAAVQIIVIATYLSSFFCFIRYELSTVKNKGDFLQPNTKWGLCPYFK